MKCNWLVKNRRNLLVLLVAFAQLPHHGLHLDLQDINSVGLLGVANDKIRQSPLHLVALCSTTVDTVVQLHKILVDMVDGVAESLVHGFIVRLEDGDLVLDLSLTKSLVVERPLVESMILSDLETSSSAHCQIQVDEERSTLFSTVKMR